MKFAKRLASEASRRGSFSAFYFDYRAAKASIKIDLTQSDVDGSNFQRVLEAELRKVSQFYSEKADRIEATLKLLRANNGTSSVEQLTQLRAEIKELIKYVALNYLAVVKAIKKRNRHLRERFGSSRPSGLQALDLLGHEVFFTSPRLASLATQADVLVSGLSSTSQPGDVLEEYQCPICLDTLHNPVVLTCAHRFCWGCLVAHVTASRESQTPLPPGASAGTDGKDPQGAACSLSLLERIAAAPEEPDTQRFYSCPVCRKPQLLDVDSLSVDPFLSSFIESLKVLSVSGPAPSPCGHARQHACSAAVCNSSATVTGTTITTTAATTSPASTKAVAQISLQLELSPRPAAAAPPSPQPSPQLGPQPRPSPQPQCEASWGIIPPQREEHRGRLCVLLDLDGTLVSSYTPRRAPRLPSYVRTHLVGTGSKLNPAGVFVVERPGLREFLQQLASFAEVIIYTAGLEDYAKPIIDAIDPSGRLFAHCIFREGTLRTDYYQCVKDMARVNRDLARTVLVDDTPLAFLHQPDNGVPVLGFRGDPDDRLLGEAVLPLMQVLARESDVRAVLRRRFDMTTWFRRNNFPIDDITAAAREAARHEREQHLAGALGPAGALALAGSGAQATTAAAATPRVAGTPHAAASTGSATAGSRPCYAFAGPRAASPTKRFAILTDFDKTLLDCDCGEALVEALAPELLPMLVGLEPTDPGVGRCYNYVPLTNSILSEVHRRGVSRDALLTALQALGAEALPLASAELLRMMHGAGVDVHIMSDANSIFISHVLAGAKVAGYVTNVVTNPAAFERVAEAGGAAETGGPAGALARSSGHRLVIRPKFNGSDPQLLPRASAGPAQHACGDAKCAQAGSPAAGHSCGAHGCSRCPENLCKGMEVQRLLHGNAYSHLVYAGDGANDVCAALALRPSDVLLARAGYPLAAYLAEARANPALPQVMAQVALWSTHEELLACVRQIVDV